MNRDFPLAPTSEPTPIQKEKPTRDSTAFFKAKVKKDVQNLVKSYEGSSSSTSVASNVLNASNKNLARQKLKGKPGYDKNGFKKP
jgi:hypothetical protein